MGTNDTATRRFVGQFAKVTGAESKPRRINPERPPTSLIHPEVIQREKGRRKGGQRVFNSHLRDQTLAWGRYVPLLV